MIIQMAARTGIVRRSLGYLMGKLSQSKVLANSDKARRITTRWAGNLTGFRRELRDAKLVHRYVHQQMPLSRMESVFPGKVETLYENYINVNHPDFWSVVRTKSKDGWRFNANV